MTTTSPHLIRVGTMAGKGPDTAAYVRALLPLGFECFQLNFWRNLDGVDLPALADAIRPDLENAGVPVSTLGVYGNPLGDTPEDEATRQAWHAAIDHAHAFGTNLICGFAGRVRNQPLPDSIPRLKEVWSPLLEKAGAKGIRIAFENCPMGGNWTTGDWNIAINPDAWELIFAALPFDNVGLEWEPCHQLTQLIDPLPQLRHWVPKIFHIHGKDASVHRDIIARHGIAGPHEFVHHRHPGFGDSNWTDIISLLRLGGYQGTIDIEGWHDPVYRDDLEMTGQVHALNYLKNCRGGTFVPNPVLG